MTLDEAIVILRKGEFIGDAVEENVLRPGREYLGWEPGQQGSGQACLDGYFSADELEAVAVFMRSRLPQEPSPNFPYALED